MEIFVSEKFIEEITLAKNSAISQNDDDMLISVIDLTRLLLSGLPVSTDINSDIAIKLFDKTGNKSYKNLKEAIASNIIKSGNYKFYPTLNNSLIQNHQAYYFYDEDSIKSRKLGLISIPNIFEIKNFFKNCIVNSITLKKDYTLIEDAVPPCNAMLIIDKYIFDGKEKLNNLIRFIKIYKNPNLSIPFQLTILSSYDNNSNRYLGAKIFESVASELNNVDNLEFQIFLDKNIPVADRLIFTNYTKGNIGHPFDDRQTVFNQNFLGRSNNIQGDYRDYKTDLTKWHILISKIPKKMGLISTKYESSLFQNRLFDNVVHPFS